MRIAVCAWGSLIWDPRTLSLHSSFTPSGPTLPLEFSRTSGADTGLRRLTLVIDEVDGAMCRTHIAKSSHVDLMDAVHDLKIREGMYSEQDVGALTRVGKVSPVRAMARHPAAVAAFSDWLTTSDFDAVVWTALPANFAARSEYGAAFSVPEALRYLGGLPQTSLDASLTYFRRAPVLVDTPLRRAVRIHWPTEGWYDVNRPGFIL